jgi:hypothetical protein
MDRDEEVLRPTSAELIGSRRRQEELTVPGAGNANFLPTAAISLFLASLYGDAVRRRLSVMRRDGPVINAAVCVCACVRVRGSVA